MDEWKEKEVLQRWAGLLEDRLYIMFIPDPDDTSKFSVEVADTIKEGTELDSNVVKLIVLGIMDLLDEDVGELVDRGQARIMKKTTEERQLTLEGIDNVLLFPDIIGSREGYNVCPKDDAS